MHLWKGLRLYINTCKYMMIKMQKKCQFHTKIWIVICYLLNMESAFSFLMGTTLIDLRQIHATLLLLGGHDLYFKPLIKLLQRTYVVILAYLANDHFCCINGHACILLFICMCFSLKFETRYNFGQIWELDHINHIGLVRSVYMVSMIQCGRSKVIY